MQHDTTTMTICNYCDAALHGDLWIFGDDKHNANLDLACLLENVGKQYSH